jgi:uncharacterized phage-associated protein
MQFLYNPRKAAQAAAYLVELNGGQMNVISLIKILYLSDRKALVRRGQPITGDRMVSMPHGPVLSQIYDLIKTGEDQQQPWYEYLTERNADTVSLRQEKAATDELSEYEREVLAAEFEQYRGLSFGELKTLTHGLPEYQDPNGSSLPIDPATILREEGWSEEDIQEVRASAREAVYLGKFSTP